MGLDQYLHVNGSEEIYWRKAYDIQDYMNAEVGVVKNCGSLELTKEQYNKFIDFLKLDDDALRELHINPRNFPLSDGEWLADTVESLNILSKSINWDTDKVTYCSDW